jgi:hypothetical protein
VKRICVALLGSWLATAGPATAAEWSFRKVADTETTAPGAVSDFSLFRAPALDGETVAFSAVASAAGIWAESSGTLRAIALAGDSLPEDADDFLDFGDPAVADGRVAFRAQSLRTRRQGIYVYGDGSLRAVARGSSGPGDGLFLSFGSVDIRGGAIAFSAVAADPLPVQGIYAQIDGHIAKLADEDSGRFEALLEPSLGGEGVVFLGRSPATRGIYVRRDDQVVALVDTTTPIPEGDGRFRDFESPYARGGAVAFVGAGGADQRGVYVLRNGELERVADRRDAAHEFFPSVAIDGARIAFHARGPLGEGLYADLGSGLALLIDTSQRLDGKQLDAVSLSPRALSGNAIAFRAGFIDGSAAIYVATPD